MTLIMTWLTPHGTIMVGDSAITTRRDDGSRFVTTNAATKVFWHERLRCGLSAWGRWNVGEQLLHNWLPTLIAADDSASLQQFATRLACELQRFHGPNSTRSGRCGIHVSGYESWNGALVPSFYHVHDGPTHGPGAAPQTESRVNFEAVHDVTPEYWTRNPLYLTRNGDYHNFAVFQEALDAFLGVLRSRGVRIPHPEDLISLGSYAVFQLRSMIDLYRMSNVLPGIGGRIDLLLFDSNGRLCQEQHYR